MPTGLHSHPHLSHPQLATPCFSFRGGGGFLTLFGSTQHIFLKGNAAAKLFLPFFFLNPVSTANETLMGYAAATHISGKRGQAGWRATKYRKRRAFLFFF